MSQRPKFSIVIPTRNRCESLAATLQTCREIDHPDFEIVVSDNHSPDATGATVTGFGDPRIRYTKTSSYVSMARNFENGLRHARGEFLIFIGDDDGILPFGLRALEAIFERYPDIDVVDWALNPFVWPHAPRARLKLNWLSNLVGSEIETAEDAWKRINHPRSIDYNELNGFNIYHGCVRRSCFDAAEADGVSLFAAPIPDVTGAIRILRYARKKMRLDVAISINGSCRMSNGIAAIVSRPTPAQVQIRTEFRAKNAADFPNAALISRAWTRENAFLGPLIDEHLETRGNLKEIDVDAWRRIYLQNFVRALPDQAELQRVEFNEILIWVEGRVRRVRRRSRRRRWPPVARRASVCRNTSRSAARQ